MAPLPHNHCERFLVRHYKTRTTCRNGRRNDPARQIQPNLLEIIFGIRHLDLSSDVFRHVLMPKPPAGLKHLDAPRRDLSGHEMPPGVISSGHFPPKFRAALRQLVVIRHRFF